MAIIDFRIRPLYGAGAKNYAEMSKKYFEAFQFEMSKSIEAFSPKLLIQEMDEAGVELGVIPGRAAFGTNNDELFAFAEQYPGRFLVFPFIDPLGKNHGLEELERTVLQGKGKGISMEPYVNTDLKIDDERSYPLYEKCNEYGLPILITFSGFISNIIDPAMVQQLDLVAGRFPNAKFVMSHGGWPWVRETIMVAFKHPNIYLIPDIYGIRCPGAQDYRDAAEYMLRDQILFASSYPVTPIRASVDNVKNWNLAPEAEEKVYYANAAKLLGLAKE